MKIVGIMLVRDEDRFVEWAIRNAIDFCDEFLVCDHQSRDETPAILARLVSEFAGRLTVRRCRDSGESHRWIESYAGTDTWIFGVDGDEIYDRSRLLRFRARLLAGEFSDAWVLFGNVLNVRELDLQGRIAVGHLAPPCRSMTKLYNFSAIVSWRGRIVERLHGGEPQFRPGFDASLRRNLYAESEWSDADFRCLHLCFLNRSSLDTGQAVPRRNIMDRHALSPGKIFTRLRARLLGKRAEDWKEQKYARGPLVKESIADFSDD